MGGGAAPQLAGLLAGGIPKLRKTGGAGIDTGGMKYHPYALAKSFKLIQRCSQPRCVIPVGPRNDKISTEATDDVGTQTPWKCRTTNPRRAASFASHLADRSITQPFGRESAKELTGSSAADVPAVSAFESDTSNHNGT